MSTALDRKLTRSLWSGWTFLTVFLHSPLCLLWFLHSAVHIDKMPFASRCLPVFAVPSTWNFFLWLPAWLSWPPPLGTKSINIITTDTPSLISSAAPPSPEPHHHHSLPFILPCFALLRLSYQSLSSAVYATEGLLLHEDRDFILFPTMSQCLVGI